MNHIQTHHGPNLHSRAKVAIVGAHGYAGLDLARVICKHPHMELSACFVRDPFWHLADELLLKEAESVEMLSLDALWECFSRFETIFFALPPEASMECISKIVSTRAQGKIPQIIDLSGAFRLSSDEALTTYNLVHPLPDLLKKAEYGLVPWSNTSQNSTFISNPGCFATSVLMAVVPLLKEGLIEPESLVIDCKSGTSGAGRKAQERLLFTEVEGDCLPYRVGHHQHLPEINRYAYQYSQVQIDPIFVTNLLPIRRGIISGIYARVNRNLDHCSPNDLLAHIESSYREAYSKYPLVVHGPLASGKKSNQSLISLRKVVGTGRTHLSYAIKESVYGTKLHVFSCIDNLLKGAASQAVENWNVSHGFQVNCGLEFLEEIL